MGLTAAEWKGEIPSDVGQTGNLTLIAKIPIWWDGNSDRSYDLKVQYLYTLKKAILWLIGQDWQLFDWGEVDVEKKESQKVKALIQLLKEVKEDIKAIESNASSPISFTKMTAGGRNDPEILDGSITSYPHPDPDPVWDRP